MLFSTQPITYHLHIKIHSLYKLFNVVVFFAISSYIIFTFSHIYRLPNFEYRTRTIFIICLTLCLFNNTPNIYFDMSLVIIISVWHHTTSPTKEKASSSSNSLCFRVFMYFYSILYMEYKWNVTLVVITYRKHQICYLKWNNARKSLIYQFW